MEYYRVMWEDLKTNILYDMNITEEKLDELLRDDNIHIYFITSVLI